MLEVCFGDSVKGALRCAQHCGEAAIGAVGVFSIGGRAEKKKVWKEEKTKLEQRLKTAVPLGGDAGDVIGLSFLLSMGDIKSPLEEGDCPRREVFKQWLSTDPWGEMEETKEEEIVAYWKSCMDDLGKLSHRAHAGDPVRIWTDQSPEGACGLLFAADLLAEADCRVTMVSLPLWKEETGDVVVEYSHWGEAPPEEFGKFLPLEQELSGSERRMLSRRWRTLREENAPLRAVVGGRVYSVSPDFYDPWIRRQMPKESCMVAQLIGWTLGAYPMGLGDWLIAKRIRAMLDSGELEMIRKGERGFYSSVISRRGE